MHVQSDLIRAGVWILLHHGLHRGTAGAIGSWGIRTICVRNTKLEGWRRYGSIRRPFSEDVGARPVYVACGWTRPGDVCCSAGSTGEQRRQDKASRYRGSAAGHFSAKLRHVWEHQVLQKAVETLPTSDCHDGGRG